LKVILVVGHESGVVVATGIKFQDSLLTLTVLEASRHLIEGDVVSVDTVINTSLIATEIIDGMLLEESSEVSMNFLFLSEIILNCWLHSNLEFNVSVLCFIFEISVSLVEFLNLLLNALLSPFLLESPLATTVFHAF
jgi:hypothetical protein